MAPETSSSFQATSVAPRPTMTATVMPNAGVPLAAPSPAERSGGVVTENQPAGASQSFGSGIVTRQEPRGAMTKVLIGAALVGLGVLGWRILSPGKDVDTGGDAKVVGSWDAAPYDASTADAAGESQDAGADAHAPVDAAPQGAASEDDEDSSVKTGAIDVEVKPWANIIIKGKTVGQTPHVKALKPGRHVIILENPALGKRERVRVTIRPGKTKKIVRKWE